jgi:pimeloyl-ACP methyl ester carboxylesterase
MGLIVLLAVAWGLLVVGLTWAILYRIGHPPRHTYATALARGLPGEPSAVGLSFVEVSFTLSDGGTTVGWIIEGGNPAGPVLIVTHGWGDCRFCRLPEAALLAPLFSRVVLYDMRGHGESQPKLCHCDRPEAADILALLDQLRQHEAIAPEARFVLMGFSMGAGITLRAAAEADNDRIAAVVLDGVYRERLVPVASHLRRRGLPSQPMIWLAERLLIWRDGPASAYDRARLAARVTCPLLALHGRGDLLCTLEHARAVVDAAPCGRMVIFDEAEHLDLARIQPQRYLAEIAAFVQTAVATAQPPAPATEPSTPGEPAR